VIQVRETNYRGEDGYLICGKSPRGHRVSIFTATEGSAQRIAAKVKAGEDITSADFEETEVGA